MNIFKDFSSGTLADHSEAVEKAKSSYEADYNSFDLDKSVSPSTFTYVDADTDDVDDIDVINDRFWKDKNKRRMKKMKIKKLKKIVDKQTDKIKRMSTRTDKLEKELSALKKDCKKILSTIKKQRFIEALNSNGNNSRIEDAFFALNDYDIMEDYHG